MAKYVEVLDGQVNTIGLDQIRLRAQRMLKGDDLELGTLYAVRTNHLYLERVSYYLISKRLERNDDVRTEYLTYSIEDSGHTQYDTFVVRVENF